MVPDELLHHIQTNQIKYIHIVFTIFQHKLKKKLYVNKIKI